MLPHLQWVYSGFWRLSNARPMGFDGPLRIPMTELEAYSRIRDLDYSRRQDLLYFVERMDNSFMAFVQQSRAEQERNQNIRNKQAPRGPPRR